MKASAFFGLGTAPVFGLTCLFISAAGHSRHSVTGAEGTAGIHSIDWAVRVGLRRQRISPAIDLRGIHLKPRRVTMAPHVTFHSRYYIAT